MEVKRTCVHCGSAIGQKEQKQSRKIGVPFSKCPKCGTFNRSFAKTEYILVNPKNQCTYFFNAGVVIFSIFIPLVIGLALYFTVGWLIAMTAAMLLPVFGLLFLSLIKASHRAEIEKSKKRCVVKGYLSYLSANGFRVDSKLKAKAVDNISLNEAIDIFGDLVRDDRFLAFFPSGFVALSKEHESSVLLSDMKKEAKENTFVPPAQYDRKSKAENINAEIEFDYSDVTSIEKYINLVLKKYNLKCSEARFQNIKIDVITYLEEFEEPDKNDIKRIIFNAIKEN